MNTQPIKPAIISVHQLLFGNPLQIPNYQRPYKWTLKHVNQLFKDIHQFRHLKAYRLGTVVLHAGDNASASMDIVDGQQRTITLSLIIHALTQTHADVMPELHNYQLPEWQFSSSVSWYNLQTNFQEISRRVKAWDRETVLFLLHRCEVVRVVLHEISEAFQFFDGQNSRGKALEPHDLLKAFHLRAMKSLPGEATTMLECVTEWESTNILRLDYLFSNYLYKIRTWSKSLPVGAFSKDDIATFKGITPSANECFPFEQSQRIVYNYAEDGRYPFQLDQPLTNGKCFFDFVKWYRQLINDVRCGSLAPTNTNFDSVKEIYATINNYDGMARTGDRYVRTLFECALAYYIDKFDRYELNRAVEKIFVWAYTIRLTNKSVQNAAINNKAIHEEPHLFWLLREATHPTDLLDLELPVLSPDKVKATKTEKIQTLFTQLRYLQ